MNRKFKTVKGIITRYIDYKEADRIFTLLSPEGLLKFLARGVKKPSSKLSGHIEPLTLVNLYFRTSKGLNSVSQVESISSFQHIKENYLLIYKAQYLVELAESVSLDEEPNEYIYNSLINTLNNLNSSQNSDILLRIFEFEILKNQGFGLEFFRCIDCSTELDKNEHFYSTYNGGMICKSCFINNQDKRSFMKLSIAEQKIFRNLSRKNYSSILKSNINKNNLLSVKKVLQTAIKNIIGVQLKTSKFLDQI